MLENILYNLPFIASLFWLLLIAIGHRSVNRRSYLMLVLYLLDAALLNYAYACMMQNACNVMVVKALHTLTLTSVFPLYYLYFRFTTDNSPLNKVALLLFAPSIILTALTIYTMIGMSPGDLTIVSNYPEFSHPDLLNSHGTQMLKHLQLASAITLLAEVLVIATASLVALYRYKRNIENFYTETHDKTSGVTFEVVVIMIIAFVSSIALVTASKEVFMTCGMLVVSSMLSTFPIFIIGIHYLRRRFTAHDLSSDELSHGMSTPACEHIVSEEDGDKQSVEVNIVYIAERIVDLVETKQQYLKPDLRITDVCDQLSTNRTYISQAINNHLGGNFSDYINRHRVEHSKRLLADRGNDNFTIEALAVQSGFATAASMNRAFRKAVGMTPHQFRQNSLLTK